MLKKYSTIILFALIISFILLSLLCKPIDNPFQDTNNVDLKVNVPNKDNGFKWCIDEEVRFELSVSFPHLVAKVEADYGEGNKKQEIVINTSSAEEEKINFTNKFATKGEKNVSFTAIMKNKGKDCVKEYNIEIGIFPKIQNNGAIKIIGEQVIGSTISLSIDHVQYGIVEYQWLRNNSLLPNSNKTNYIINNLKTSDEGIYQCIIKTDWGSDSSKVLELNIDQQINPPLIIVHPIEKHVTVGSTALFTIIAEGEKVSYQWQKNENDIAGATLASFETGALKKGDDASYRCKVTNVSGIVFSNKASLIVYDKAQSTKITKHPKDQEVEVGDYAYFYIEAKGTDLKFQWFKNGEILSNATLELLKMGPVLLTDNGNKYKCKISNSEGKIETNEAVLKVINAEKPIVTKHPQSVTVKMGDGAVFSVEAQGKNLEYQWKQNGKIIVSGTNTFYSYDNAKLKDNGDKFCCIVSNSGGEVKSKEAILTVIKEATKPEISKQPQDQEATEGEEVTFSVVAVGSDLTYQWQKNSSDISGAIENEYTHKGVKKEENGTKFRCKVTNSQGSVTSNEATLKVVEKIIPPEITKQPEDNEVKLGEKASFSVKATGTNLKYQWKKNGNNISSATASICEIQSVAKEDNDLKFSCEVSNSAGKKNSEAAQLSVYYVEITKQPSSPGEVIMGSGFSLNVEAEGNPTPKFEWLKNGSKVGSDATYNVSNASDSDKGSYKCKVYNDNDCEIISSTITINVKDKAPVITLHPRDKVVKLSSSNGSSQENFSVKASGTNLSYSWVGVPNASNAPDVSVYLNKNYDKQSIYCTVSNSAGSVPSNVAKITVNWPPDRPSIRVSPSNTTVKVGTQLTFTATLGNMGNPLGQGAWWHKGQNNVGQSTVYIIPKAEVGHSGSYTYSILWQGSPYTSSVIYVTVEKINHPPIIDNVMRSYDVKRDGHVFSILELLKIKDEDDGDADKCTINIESQNQSGDAGLRASASPRALTISVQDTKKDGNLTVSVSVSDGKNKSNTRNLTFNFLKQK